MTHKYTKNQIETVVSTSTSYAQALTKLGVVPAGGNYRIIKKYIRLYNIPWNHYIGQGHNKNRTFGPKRPISDYLSGQAHIASHVLRKRLIKEGIFEHKCKMCGLTEWLDDKIPLELDHIDGNHHNNLLENLRLLCPNCHTKTPTYRGRNMATKKIRNPITPKTKPCSTPRTTKINWPPMDELLHMLSESNYTALGKKLGVSDNAIRKHIALLEK